MKSTHFCYWLQGLFELAKVKELNSVQTQEIKSHLDLVFKFDSEPSGFCHWLKGVYDLVQPTEFNEKMTKTLKAKLEDVFRHEIDPSYGKKWQQELNDIHQGKTPKKKKQSVDIRNVKMMC